MSLEPPPGPGELAEIVAALHGDRAGVLKAQLTSIDAEIGERRLVAVDTTLVVHDELGRLRDEELNLTNDQNPNEHLRERLALQQEELGLSRELREEQRDSWKDVQSLRQEQRLVEKELTVEDHHHKRTKELL